MEEIIETKRERDNSKEDRMIVLKTKMMFEDYDFKTPDVEVREIISNRLENGRKVTRYSVKEMRIEDAKELYEGYRIYKIYHRELNKNTLITYITKRR